MRKAYLLLGVFAPAALVWACGGSDDSVLSDGGPDGSTTDGTSSGDTAPSTDAPNDTSVNNDGGGTDSSTTDASTGDTGVTVTCLSPAECDGGNVCCGDLGLNGGTSPNCNVTSASTACKSGQACPTNLGASLNCKGTDQARLCTKNADCTEQFYNKCCTLNNNDAGISFCASTQLLGNAGTCM